ncbi:Glyoxysomal fatty acid beta-oxidation multifunctional protein MFP-a [Diplonema papillatum]|nr:Glyoxysomal fatty acid beta-oxidation multifunctional protein MFP-a [Diplonema papillatum]|eukprot:gene1251-1939_t
MAPKGKKAAPKGTVHLEVREHAGKKVAVLTMDNPPANPLSLGIRMGFDKHLKEVMADSSIAAVVVTGAHKNFCAGADISEFSGGMRGPSLPELISRMETASKPVVAAIDGVALGGGCEVSLGCHWRLATKRSIVGLPEVNLGLLPGAGGTQRMPRLIGGAAAIDAMCIGAPLNAAKAKQVGIFDQIIEGDVVAAAVKFAAGEALSANLDDRRLCNRTTQLSEADLKKAAAKFGKMRKGEVAPEAIIRCVVASTRGTFAEGMKVEGAEFMKLFSGDQPKAMQYMFFAERACWKVPGLTAKPADLKTVGVIGAGLMGGGIAMCCAEAGINVLLVDAKPEFLERGMKVIEKNYGVSVKRGSMKEEKAKQAFSRIRPSGSDYAVFKDCDMVIEAVFENMDIKKQVFGKLDKVCKRGCILASNTSYLSIDEIASATSRPEDVIGTHFFSPANVMKLLENVRGKKTSQRTIATAMAFGKRIGKIAVLVNNCHGFVANRMMAMQGANKLLYSGLLPHVIDNAAENFGFRMGPMRMGDLVGLDLGAREREREGKLDVTNNLTDFLYKRGDFGMKTGCGIYKYDERRKATRNSETEEFLNDYWKRHQVVKRSLTDDQIVREIYFPVINEGFKCLEDGIVNRVSDIDIAIVYGYNFPRYRGGPMKFAELTGLDEVLDGIKKLGITPSKLLEELVENGTSLAKFSKRLEKEQAAKL